MVLSNLSGDSILGAGVSKGQAVTAFGHLGGGYICGWLGETSERLGALGRMHPMYPVSAWRTVWDLFSVHLGGVWFGGWVGRWVAFLVTNPHT